jgi:putative endonuclease
MPSAHQSRGFEEEATAEALLRERGYRIVGRNVRAGRYELDLVAWDGRVLCFIEVRYRRDLRHGRAEETVRRDKQARLIRAATAYIRSRFARWPVIRFDVVAVHGQGRAKSVRLIRNAFDAAGFD